MVTDVVALCKKIMTSERIKRLLIGFQSIQPTEVESEKCSPSQNVSKRNEHQFCL